MSLFKSIAGGMARRKLVREAASSDGAWQEAAIKAMPGPLDAAAALAVLLPLSRGEGSHLAGKLTNLPATPTYEFSAGVHLRSTITALGRIEDQKATDRLFEIVSDLPNLRDAALLALGSRHHAGAAERLAAVSEKWSIELRWKAAKALWSMESEQAFQLYMKIQKATGSPMSEETMRAAWSERMADLKRARQ